MSRFLKTMVVLLTIAAFAAPAFATDFSISGQMRVENYINSVDDDTPGQDAITDAHFDQRLRVQSVWKVSDDVKVVLRTDIGESAWGSNGQYSVRHPASNSGQFQIDKAYLQIDKEVFTFSAGQMYYGTANTILVDHVGTGMQFKLNTPVSLKLMYTKYDENGSNVDDDDTEDKDFYGADVGFKTDAFSINGIVALLDDKVTDATKTALVTEAQRVAAGVAVGVNIGIFTLKAELDVFGGDYQKLNAVTGQYDEMDFVGTQLYVDANFSLTEAFNLGGWLWYVAGTDADDETVIADITNWDDFNPLLGGYAGQTIVAAMPFVGWGPNDMISNSGLVGGAIYSTVNFNDWFGMKFQGSYIFEDDDSFESYDLAMGTVSAKFKIATNTYLMADLIASSGTYELTNIIDSERDISSASFWTQLQVNF